MDWLRKRNRAKKLKKWLEKAAEDFEKIDKTKARIRKEALKSAEGFIRALEAKGFERLGGGAYSTVLAYPGSPKVIKVCRNPEGDGWIDYVRWASENGFAGTFAPKVFSYKYIKHELSEKEYPWQHQKKGFGVATMERIDTILGEVKRGHDAVVVDKLFAHAVTTNNELAKKLLDTIQPNFGLFSAGVHAKFGDNLDLHGGNVMVRKDGSVCVTDPVAGRSSDKYMDRFTLTDLYS